MFVFMDNIMKLQATIYIKLHSTNATAVRSRNNSEKETFDIEIYHKYARGELSIVTMFVYYNFQSLISPCCPVTVNRELSRSDYVCVL
jgi:hypothetical protein